MKTSFIKSVVLAGFVMCLLACQNKVDIVNAPTQLLSIDSIPDIKHLTDIRFHNNDVLLTYESRGSYGQQFVRQYVYDNKKAELKYKRSLFRNDNGQYDFYIPILFSDNKNDLFVVDREMPTVYKVSDEGQAITTGDVVISRESKTPYPIVMDARQVFQKSLREYLFVGREPNGGAQSLFLSKNEDDSVCITEISKIIYNPDQPSWITNFGKLAYNDNDQIGVFAFQMYPVIQYINLQTGEKSSFRLSNTIQSELITDGADIWEQNPVYFRDITSNSKYIYALYWGKTFQDAGDEQAEGKGFSQIYKFDWDWKLKQVYNINKCLNNICIDNTGNSIIGFDGYIFYSIGF